MARDWGLGRYEKSDSLILNTIHDEKCTSESFDSDVLFVGFKVSKYENIAMLQNFATKPRTTISNF